MSSRPCYGNLIGLVIYERDGEVDYRTKSGVHVQQGYIYFRDADEIEAMGEIRGKTMHSRLYYKLTGEMWPPKVSMIMSGFARQDGVWKGDSWTFNDCEGDDGKDHRTISDDELGWIKGMCIEFLSSGKQNFLVQKEKDDSEQLSDLFVKAMLLSVLEDQVRAAADEQDKRQASRFREDDEEEPGARPSGPHRHPLRAESDPYASRGSRSYRCNICRRSFTGVAYHCSIDDWDECPTCYPLNSGAPSAEIKAALNAGRCTYSVTGRDYEPQMYYNCLDCRFVNGKGLCGACATACHLSHRLEGPFSSSGFFCDCGAGDGPRDCRCLKGKESKKVSKKSYDSDEEEEEEVPKHRHGRHGGRSSSSSFSSRSRSQAPSSRHSSQKAKSGRSQSRHRGYH
jgi:hypothetical protein